MSEGSFVDVLSNYLVGPAFEWARPLQPLWEALAQNPQRLAAVCVVVGAICATVGARLLLVSALLLLATPDIVMVADHIGETVANLTKVLYVIGVLGGALGLLEATLKLMFGRDAGAYAFAGVIGTALGAMIPFLSRRR